jgi:type II secretory pathway predicted ATPase ExeA
MPMPTATPGLDLRQLLKRGQRVFASHPQVANYFPSTAIENARQRIKRAIDRGDGPALVVGSPGMGKSLLLQVIAAQYQAKFDVVLLACARICTRRALLQSILFELGLPYQQRDEGQLRLSLLDHLLDTERCPCGLVLLVDEAQSLSVTLLDELRVLTNLLQGGAPRVRLIVAGCSALEESFAHPELESLSQRLSARCYLTPLGRDETSEFVRAQISAAGASPEKTFASDAEAAVFDATDGVPRLINQLCDRALLIAEQESSSLVDRQIIQQAWSDLQQLPVAWEARSSTPATARPSQAIEFGTLVDTEAELESIAIESRDLERAQVTLRAKSTNELPSTSHQRGAPTETASPSGPFAEQYDEEEVVLDRFAAWEDIFHGGTPRVENQRDPVLANLVRAAVEANLATDAAQPDLADQAALDCHELENDEAQDSIDPLIEGRELHNWPRLRLADVSDVPIEPQSCSSKPVPHSAKNGPQNVAQFAAENPILTIEEEVSADKLHGAPVRSLAYRHLFSRLRSG